MTKPFDIVDANEWSPRHIDSGDSRHNLFNSDILAKANRLEGHTPFLITVNETEYLAYKRHASAVVSGMALNDLVTLLQNVPRLRAILEPMGIKNVSFNTLNAVNDREALAEALELSGKLRTEYLMDITRYTVGRISLNHKRNIKKSNRAGARIMLPTDIEGVQSHIDLVNSNLENKGVGGITNGPEYFLSLVEKQAGLLVQVMEDEQLLASTFFFTNQDYAYYHSSGTSDRGKEVGAAYFLVDRMTEEMRKRNISYLNLGGCTSEQLGLQRFKMGFRPEVRVLASASCPLFLSARQKIRSLLTTKHADILKMGKVAVYVQPPLHSVSVYSEDYSLQKLSYEQLFEAVSATPELGPCLERFCLFGTDCYGLFFEHEKIVAIGFIESGETFYKPDLDKVSTLPNLAEIGHILVVSNVRERGIGKLMLELLSREIAVLGFKRVCCRVLPQDNPAQKAILAAGFQFERDVKLISSEIERGVFSTVGQVDI